MGHHQDLGIQDEGPGTGWERRTQKQAQRGRISHFYWEQGRSTLYQLALPTCKHGTMQMMLLWLFAQPLACPAG